MRKVQRLYQAPPPKALQGPWASRSPEGSQESHATRRRHPQRAGLGMLYAVLDGKGKLAINGTFEGMGSPATVAHLHFGAEGQPGKKVADLTVSKSVSGVIKGNVMMSEADIQELQKGACYVQIDTEQTPEGALRGWLATGMLK